ncbi:hypothetical protein OR573_03095 [Halomonas sp. CH40]
MQISSLTHALRRSLTPALLALALMPLALTAQADQHGKHDGERGNQAEQMQERMQERRAEMYQRAGISEEKQTQLEEAREVHYNAMREVREEHQARIRTILSDEERQSLESTMREMREEFHEDRRQQGQKGHGQGNSPQNAE